MSSVLSENPRFIQNMKMFRCKIGWLIRAELKNKQPENQDFKKGITTMSQEVSQRLVSGL